MAAAGPSRGVIFATVGFSVGILYSVKTQRDAAKRRARPSPALSRLDVSRLCGQWYQVAAVDASYFQRGSRDAVVHISRDPPQQDGRDEAGEGGGGDGFVPRGEEYTAMTPELYLRRVEVLGGKLFGGKQLVTDAHVVRPEPRQHPARFVYTAVSGMERQGVPWWVIAAGNDGSGAGAGGGANAGGSSGTSSQYGYVVVADGPLRDTARVLSQQPRLPADTLRRLKDDLDARGYDVGRFSETEQSAAVQVDGSSQN